MAKASGATAKAKKPAPFVAVLGDVPLRDDREGMSVPMVSLSKGKRTAPIEWRSSDGKRYVRVTADATHGMATIWDWDVLIWAASQINAAVEAGQPPSEIIRFQPHDMLKAIGRGVSGRDYQELEAALRRLKGTNVETNIRIGNSRHVEMFGLLVGWTHITDEATGRSEGMTLTLSWWIYQGALKQDVLAIPPAYFDLSSGIARWLYRLARRHGGKQATGFRFTMQELHARSGSPQPMKDFARAIRAIARGQGLPEYRLDLIQGQHGDEVLTMVRDPAKGVTTQRRDLTRTRLPALKRPVD
jgi:plasmid replication initiation protein